MRSHSRHLRIDSVRFPAHSQLHWSQLTHQGHHLIGKVNIAHHCGTVLWNMCLRARWQSVENKDGDKQCQEYQGIFMMKSQMRTLKWVVVRPISIGREVHLGKDGIGQGHRHTWMPISHLVITSEVGGQGQKKRSRSMTEMGHQLVGHVHYEGHSGHYSKTKGQRVQTCGQMADLSPLNRTFMTSIHLCEGQGHFPGSSGQPSRARLEG